MYFDLKYGVKRVVLCDHECLNVIIGETNNAKGLQNIIRKDVQEHGYIDSDCGRFVWHPETGVDIRMVYHILQKNDQKYIEMFEIWDDYDVDNLPDYISIIKE